MCLQLYRYTVLCFALYGSSSSLYGIIHNMKQRRTKDRSRHKSPHGIKNRKSGNVISPEGSLGKPIWGNPANPLDNFPGFLFCEPVTRPIRDLPQMTFKSFFFFSFGFFNRPFDVVKLSFLDPLPCLGGFVVDSGAPFYTDRVIRAIDIHL